MFRMCQMKLKKCPEALRGVVKGKSGKSKVRTTERFSLDLWVWYFTFGLFGSLNDFNILEVSPYYARVFSETFIAVSPSYEIGVKLFDWFYSSADGIFPSWKIFVK